MKAPFALASPLTSSIHKGRSLNLTKPRYAPAIDEAECYHITGTSVTAYWTIKRGGEDPARSEFIDSLIKRKYHA